MRVIGLGVILIGCLLFVPFDTEAQQASSPAFRVAFLSGYSASGASQVRRILADGLRDLGYREGENLVLVERYADGKMERLPGLARELVQLHVDVNEL